MRIKALVLVVTLGVLAAGCDTPAENATEEQIEDRGEAAGQSEDAAEQQGEAAKDAGTTDTGSTVMPPSDTSATSATSVTTT